MAYAPDGAVPVFADEKTAVFGHGNSHRATPDFTLGRDEAGHKILVFTTRFTGGIIERSAHDPVTSSCSPVPSGLNSKIRARFSSEALSDTFEREPIDTYIFLPSGEKTISRVQCPPPRINPPGERCAASCWAGPRALRSPLLYGNRITPSVFATYKNCGSSPGGEKAIPNG